MTADAREPKDIDEMLRLVYQEICRSHGAIADFRAKLLALIPLASGAGVFTVLGKFHGEDKQLLVPIGLFGFAFTFGLFIYELRGIEDCTMLRERAQTIEKQLKVPKNQAHFLNWAPGRIGLVDEIGAGLIVYSAVLLSWLYVAVTGFVEVSTWWYWVLAVVAVGLYVAALTLGRSIRGRRLWTYDADDAERRIKRVEEATTSS